MLLEYHSPYAAFTHANMFDEHLEHVHACTRHINIRNITANIFPFIFILYMLRLFFILKIQFVLC